MIFILSVVIILLSCLLLTLDIFFCQITTFIKVRVAFVFELQTFWLLDFSKNLLIKGAEAQKQRTFMNVVIWQKKIYLVYKLIALFGAKTLLSITFNQ